MRVGGRTIGRRITSVGCHSRFGGTADFVPGALKFAGGRNVTAMRFCRDECRAFSGGSSSDKGRVRARGRDGDGNSLGGVGGDDSWVPLPQGSSHAEHGGFGSSFSGFEARVFGQRGSRASLGFPSRSVLMFSVPRVLAVSGRRERDVSGAVLAAGGYRVSYEGGSRSVCDPGLGDAASWDRLVLLDVDSFLAVIALI